MATRRSMPEIRRELQSKIDAAGEYWTEKQPADLGNYAGVVKVPDAENMVYVRLSNGQVVQVFNSVAPNIYNWKVYVGRDKSQPGLLKVLEVRWVYNIAQTVAYVLFHHRQHEYPNPDTVWVRRDQFMPLLVLPRGGFTVHLFGDLIYRSGMTTPIRVSDQDIDLSSHVIATGAKYVLLEILQSGALNYITGTTYDNRDILYTQNYPVPTDGAFPICIFVFYEAQTELRRDSTERTIIDLRMFTSDTPVTDSGVQIGDAPADTPLDADKFGFWDVVDGLLKSIAWANLKVMIRNALALDDLIDVNAPAPEDAQVLTYDAYAEEWIAADSTAVGTGSGAFQRVLTADLTLEDGESLVVVDYIDGNGFTITLDGDAVIAIINVP